MARGRYLLLLGLAFALTRGFLFWSAHWDINLANSADIGIYESWAQQLQDANLAPYAGIAIEYPPGVLPAVVFPEMLKGSQGSYLEPFILIMLAVDIAAFAGLVLASRRVGRRAPPWFWIAATTLLGPIIYLRLDLVPAAATIWFAERLAAGSWGGAGGWLGFGTLAKVYPGFLLPAALVASPNRKRFLLAAAAVVGLLLLPFVGALPDLWRSVFSFHAGRGIQAESTWGLVFTISSRLQGFLVIDLTFGAVHIGSSAAAITKLTSLILTVGVVGFGTWVAARLPRGEPAPLTQLLFGMLALLLAFGTVFSPQFVLWLIALAAGALCFSRISWPLALVLPVAALTHASFLQLAKIVTADYALTLPLLVRNTLVFAAGMGALFGLQWTRAPSRLGNPFRRLRDRLPFPPRSETG
ncbi:MAG TPA: glycosyltransferase 87 family protein [Actinomycetota bacterium]|nr:glycosyltransferase 87 family protein [Actinomycetota bacterium]